MVIFLALIIDFRQLSINMVWENSSFDFYFKSVDIFSILFKQ